MLKNKKIAWTATVCWMALIFILSHQPASASSGLSSGITAIIFNIITTIIPNVEFPVESFHFLLRKSAHFIAYFVLGILLLNALNKKLYITLKAAVSSLVIAALYAVSDEIHQLFIEGRSGEFRDVLIDSAGAATGIVIYWTLHSLITKNRATKNTG